jgi:RHS repeat-associated protein
MITDNSTGAALDTITYDGFGNVRSETSSANGDRYGFTGRERDNATGLQYNRDRWYNPATGTWMQQDPLGLGPDTNPYRYVGNDPTNATDPSGLAPPEPPPFGQGGEWLQRIIGDKAAKAAEEAAREAKWLGRFATTARALGAVAGIVVAVDQFGEARQVWNDWTEYNDFLERINRQNQASMDRLLRHWMREAAGQCPAAMDVNEKPHGGPAHDAAIKEYIKILERDVPGARDIRKNQAQVNADKQKVSDYRPDVQWTDANGVRHYYEVSSRTSTANPARLRRNDPNAIIEVLDLQTGITTVYKPGMPLP